MIQCVAYFFAKLQQNEDNTKRKPLFCIFILLFYRFNVPLQKRNSTFANGEVKEFKEVREVKAICFIAKYTTKRLLAITSNDRRE